MWSFKAHSSSSSGGYDLNPDGADQTIPDFGKVLRMTDTSHNFYEYGNVLVNLEDPDVGRILRERIDEMERFDLSNLE